MRSRVACLWIALACLAVGCRAAPDHAPSTNPSGLPPSSTAAPTGVASSPAAALLLPAPGDLPFPPPRDLPIEPAEDPTPENVIDSFHSLVHHPALTYHAEGTARWVVDGEELLSATSIDHDGGDRFMRFADEAEKAVEAIVSGASAAVRQGAGEWQPTDAQLLRGFNDLSTAVVIGDLGAEPDGSGFRLVVDAGFEIYPESVAGTGGSVHRVTEIVVDELGLPIHLTFHQWSRPSTVGETGLPEGIAAFRFEQVGQRIVIPPLPSEETAEPSSAPTTAPLINQALPGGGWTVDLPGSAEPTSGRYGFAGGEVDVEQLVARLSTGGRFEAGSASIPVGTLEGYSADERLGAIRYAVTSQLPGGDVLGYRSIEINGSQGQEIVAEGYDEQRRGILYRIRAVLIDDRLIVLTVGGASAIVGSAETDRILASLTSTTP